jgi:hypothetical protein
MSGDRVVSSSGGEDSIPELGGRSDKRVWQAPKLLRLDGRTALAGGGTKSDGVFAPTSAS